MGKANQTMRECLCVVIALGIATLFFAGALDAQDAAADAAPQTEPIVRAPSALDAPVRSKVWTNEDLSSLPRAAAPAKPKPAAGKPPAKPALVTGKTPTATKEQQQILKLQAQLPPLEGQIAQLQDALSGKPVETARKYGWQSPGDWREQLAQLQKKRDDIEVQIQALEDQARHRGAAVNSLP